MVFSSSIPEPADQTVVTQPRSRTLLLHGGALGDCVLALHLCTALKRALPATRFTVAARSSIVRWAKRHGWIDGSWSIEEIGVHGLYDRRLPLPRQTIESFRGFDGVFSFLGGRREIVSQRLEELAECRVFSIDPRPAPGQVTHIVEQWVGQLRVLGLPVEVPSGDELEIRDRRTLRDQLRLRLGATADRIVLCHPGSGGLAKCCPLEALERLIAAIPEQGCAAAWMIGPDEQERFGAQYVRRLERTASVLYEESVDLAADLVAGADAFVGNDAGMTHVAASCGVRTFALFGPTDPAIWRPLGPDCIALPFPGGPWPIDVLLRDVASQVAGNRPTSTAPLRPG